MAQPKGKIKLFQREQNTHLAELELSIVDLEYLIAKYYNKPRADILKISLSDELGDNITTLKFEE